MLPDSSFLFVAVPIAFVVIIWFAMRQSSDKPQCIFVIGPPGAGKGTQSALIVANHSNVKHYSVGDLLRHARDTNHPHATLIATAIAKDDVVPVHITLAIMKEAMDRDVKHNKIKGFLIDGYPRNMDNLNGWNEHMSRHVDLRGVILLTIDDDVAIQRAGGRMRDHNDIKEAALKRLATRKQRSLPVIEYYQKRNLLRIVDANEDKETVYNKVNKIVTDLFQL
mmetsp:Transcript_18259/g.29055  ORF Transcript_18259/g.29055 Transcript_18259/m.29055 type:complete len:223 (+) Transcript_18259:74-742(+)